MAPLYGLAIAFLPWLHTRFSILAGALGLLLTLRVWQDNRSLARVAALAAVPLASLALWLWFFYVLYGTPNPAAPYGGYTQSSLSNAWRGISGLLIDQQFGLLPNAPVYFVALGGIAALWRVRRRILLELAFVVVPYVMAAASYYMWWGGTSAPARFLVPVLLPAGLAVAVTWHRSQVRGRAAILVLLAGSIAITAILAIPDRGALAYNTRDGYALWLEWIAPIVRLPLAVPSLFRFGGPLTIAWAQAAAWALGAAVGWAILRKAPTAASVIPGVVALVIMVGSTLAWALVGADAIDEGSGLWRVARAAASPGAVGVRLPSFRVADAAAIVSQVPLIAPAPRFTSQGPLFTARGVPPGQYVVQLPGTGTLGATIGGRAVPPFISGMSSAGGARSAMRLDLPFGAAALRIDSLTDPVAPAGTAALIPIHLTRAAVPLARAAVPFGRGTLWLLDDDAWAEAGGLWTRGTRAVTIAVDVNGAVPLRVRTGPVAATVDISAGTWRAALALEPGETREVDVPVSAPRTPVAIAADRAFRPLDYDERNSDARLLGVWVEIR
jgi:hypothetical protein